MDDELLVDHENESDNSDLEKFQGEVDIWVTFPLTEVPMAPSNPKTPSSRLFPTRGHHCAGSRRLDDFAVAVLFFWIPLGLTVFVLLRTVKIHSVEGARVQSLGCGGMLARVVSCLHSTGVRDALDRCTANRQASLSVSTCVPRFLVQEVAAITAGYVVSFRGCRLQSGN